jgi:hypothetical protein
MKRMIIILMSVFFCITLTDYSLAGHLGKYMSTVKVPKEIPGTLSSIDMSKGTVTIKIKTKDTEFDRVFVFNDTTAVMKGTEKRTIKDLKPGNQVTIVYIREGDSNIAQKIIIEKELFFMVIWRKIIPEGLRLFLI